MRSSLVLVMSLIFAVTASAQKYPYRVVDLGGSGSSNPWGITDDGSAIAGFVGSNGFIWHDGSGMTLLGSLPGYTQSAAFALDAAGIACGSAGVASPGPEPLRAVRFRTDGTVEDLGTLGGLYSTASEMNRLGHIVGDTSTIPGTGDWHAFLWTGRMLDLSPGLAESHAMDVNDFDAVTGCTGPAAFSAPNRAFRWTPALGLVDLGIPTGFKNSFGLGINAAGQVCGVATTPTGLARAWMRYADNTGWQVLLPNAALSTAWKINDFGQVVGDTNTGGGAQRAAVYTDGIGMQDLNSLINPASGWVLMAAHDINERGRIVGWGRDSSGLIRGYLLDPAFFTAYGTGCAGGGGHIPVLGGWGLPVAGHSVQLMMAEGVANGAGLLFASVNSGSQPLGACTWLLGAPLGQPMPLHFDVNRQARLGGMLPADVPSGLSVFFQFASLDGGAPNGAYALSNGLEMILP